MKWFKHDTNAHTDAKLDKVLMHYGAHGYAVYWYCLELIAGKIEKQNIECELEHDAEQIGSRLKIDSAEVNAILTYMIDLGLFERQLEGAITCLKLLGRLDKSMTNSPQLRQMIGKIRQETSGNVMTFADMSENVTPEQNRIEQNRIEQNRKNNSPSGDGRDCDDDSETDKRANEKSFKEFWALYPRKEAKKRSAVAWANLTKKKQKAAIARLKQKPFEGVARRYIPLPPTWLNGERWEDEFVLSVPENFRE